MSVAYRIVERVPTFQEYRDLCTAVGWAGVINFEAARTALPNSLYGVVAMHDTRAVGMGRVVGDGAIFYYIQDVAVHPEHQGQGVGKLLLQQLVGYIKCTAPERAFLGLFAASGTQHFYEQFGFRAWPEMTGMFQVVPVRDDDISDRDTRSGG
jgi:GNAT superfamily N-acetyltransferase